MLQLLLCYNCYYVTTVIMLQLLHNNNALFYCPAAIPTSGQLDIVYAVSKYIPPQARVNELVSGDSTRPITSPKSSYSGQYIHLCSVKHSFVL